MKYLAYYVSMKLYIITYLLSYSVSSTNIGTPSKHKQNRFTQNKNTLLIPYFFALSYKILIQIEPLFDVQ